MNDQTDNQVQSTEAEPMALWRKILLYLLAAFFIVSVVGQLRNIGFQDDISLVHNLISISIRFAGILVGIALILRSKWAVYIFATVSIINPVWTYLFPKLGYVEEKYFEPVWLFFLFGFPLILIGLMMVNWKYYR